MLDDDFFYDADLADGGTVSYVVTEYGTASFVDIRGTTYNGGLPLKSFSDLSSKTTKNSIAASGETETGTLNLESQAVLYAGMVRWEKSGNVNVRYDRANDVGATASIYDSFFFQTKSRTIDNEFLTKLDGCVFVNCTGDNLVYNSGSHATMSMVNSSFGDCDGRNIVHNNGGKMTIEGSSFSHCSCAVRQSGKNSCLVIRDSTFATPSDAIVVEKNGTNSSFTIGGAITTAAQISSKIAVKVEPGTTLVLNLSNYYVPNSKKGEELLDGYKTMFCSKNIPGKDNLTIVINVRSNQTTGTYRIASDASGFGKDNYVYVRCGDKKDLLFLKQKNVHHGAEMFCLKLSGGNLTLDVVYGIELTVDAGKKLDDDEECLEVRKLDVKKGGTYTNCCGMTASTTSCVVKLAEGATVSVKNFVPASETGKTNVTMSKNAILDVKEDMSVNKLTSGQWSEVEIGGILSGGTASNSVSIGKESTFSAGDIDLKSGKNKISLGANSFVIIGGETACGSIRNVQALTLSAGAMKTLSDKTKEQCYTEATIHGDVVFSDEANGKLSIGKFAVAALVGSTIPGSTVTDATVTDSTVTDATVTDATVTDATVTDATVTDSTVTAGVGRSLAISIGANGTMSVGDICGASSLKLTSGTLFRKNSKDETKTQGLTTLSATSISGSMVSTSAFSFGNYCDVTVENIEFSTIAKSSLSIGGKGTMFDAGTISGLASLKIGAGTEVLSSTVTVGHLEMNNLSTSLSIGKFATFTAGFGDDPGSGKVSVTVNTGASFVVSEGALYRINSLKMCAGNATSHTRLETNEIAGTDGNDKFSIASCADVVVDTFNCLSGNDTISVSKNGRLKVADVINMGVGRNALIVSSGRLETNKLDVHGGTCSITVNGKGTLVTIADLELSNGTAVISIGSGAVLKTDFSNVSKNDGLCSVKLSGELNLTGGTWNENVLVSGKGKITVDSDCYDDAKEKWDNTWCVGGTAAARAYSGETLENADNTIKTARDLELELDSSELDPSGKPKLDGWLCDSELIEGVRYITDEVDYFKFDASLSYSSLKFEGDVSVRYSKSGKDDDWRDYEDGWLAYGGYVKIELNSNTDGPAAYTITGTKKV